MSFDRFLNYVSKEFHNQARVITNSCVYSRKCLQKILVMWFIYKDFKKDIKKSILRNLGLEYSCKNVLISPSDRSNSEINFSIWYDLITKIRFASNAKPSEWYFAGETTRRIRYFFRDNGFSRALLRDLRNHHHKFSHRSFRWAQRNLLMQIRRSYNAWMRMILIDDLRERFVSFSPTRCHHPRLPLSDYRVKFSRANEWSARFPYASASMKFINANKTRVLAERHKKNPFIDGRTYTFDLISLFALECLSNAGKHFNWK